MKQDNIPLVHGVRIRAEVPHCEGREIYLDKCQVSSEWGLVISGIIWLVGSGHNTGHVWSRVNTYSRPAVCQHQHEMVVDRKCGAQGSLPLCSLISSLQCPKCVECCPVGVAGVTLQSLTLHQVSGVCYHRDPMLES